MKRKRISIITGLCLTILTLGACSSQSQSNKTETTTSTTQLQTAKHQDVRFNVDKIKVGSKDENFKGGSSLAELKSLFGEPAKQFDTPAGDVTLKGYTWTFDNVSVTAQLLEDSTIVRTINNFQFVRDAKITQKQYNKLENGISFTQVKDILGVPDTLSEAISSDKAELQASWTSGIKSSTSNPNITLTFENGQLTSKTQVGLN